MYRYPKDKTGDTIRESFLSGCLGCGTALLLLLIFAVLMQKGIAGEQRGKLLFGLALLIGCFVTANRMRRKIGLGLIPTVILSALSTLSILGLTAAWQGRGGVKTTVNAMDILLGLSGSLLGAVPGLLKSNKRYKKVTRRKTAVKNKT